MSNSYVIDTFAWVEYALGTEMGAFVAELLNAPDSTLYTPAIVIAELSFKFNNENIGDWGTFFKFIKEKTQVVPLDGSTANQSGLQKQQLRATEKGIDLADAIIYQTALNLHAALISGDEHFKAIDGVIYLKNSVQVEDRLAEIRKRGQNGNAIEK